jgi:hypothetical protein
VVTRNHYTEVDWNRSNCWLVRDLTRQLAGDRAVAFAQKIDRANFFKKRYKLAVDVPIEMHRDAFLPFAQIDLAKPHLADGDFVNIVRGVAKPGAPPNETFGGSAWVGHVGLIVHDAHGEVQLIHSARPTVRAEVLDEYIAKEAGKIADRDAAGKARLVGFKFLRLTDDPIAQLRRIDGTAAPRLSLPPGGPVHIGRAVPDPGGATPATPP